jgi:hypothetical protein
MQLNKYLLSLSLLLALLSNVGCAVQDRVVLKTQFVAPNIPLQEKPKGINMANVQFYAVTEANLEQFLNRFSAQNSDIVFFAISVKDYENLSLNVAELKRYIKQQQSIILYYESSIKMVDMSIPSEREEVINNGTINTLKSKLGIE